MPCFRHRWIVTHIDSPLALSALARIASEAKEPRTRLLRVLLLGAIAAACLAAPASAQYLTLHGSASATGASAASQTILEMPTASLSGVMSQDAVGNDGKANGSLATPDGRFTLSGHACSGGGPGFGGNANGSADASITLDYQITSATLPDGTPVSVSIRWAVAGRATAAGNLTHYTSASAGTLDGHVFITVGGVTIVNLAGTRRREHNTNTPSQYYHFISGTLNTEEASGDYTVNALVGQTVRIVMTGTASGNSSATLLSVTDGDAQMSMVWGVTSETPGASVVTDHSPPGQPAPPAAMATPAHAAEILPPRPVGPGILQCFEVPTQPVPVGTCATVPGTFSVAATGTSPFTYQWQIQTTSEFWSDLNTTPVALPCGGSATADAPLSASTHVVVNPCPNVIGDSTYKVRCVITNPCGSIASNPASLHLCMSDINCTGTIDIDDLVAVITTWGAARGAADITRNGIVDIDDLVEVIVHWGVCQ